MRLLIRLLKPAVEPDVLITVLGSFDMVALVFLIFGI
jgi:hypothetical protein